MFKKYSLLVVILVAVFMVSGLAMAQEADKTAETAVAADTTEAPAAPVVVGNKVCPITGMAIPEADMSKNTVEYEGKVYNLCCPDCKAAFMADPIAAVAKVEAQMVKE
jgi:YHS domain-containing protein